MKKFIIGLFKKFPTATGLVLLLISCHLTGIKKLTTSFGNAPETFWNIVIIYFIITFVFLNMYLPEIEEKKRESSTWTLIITSVICLTILAKLFP